jgi:hypothetical protein
LSIVASLSVLIIEVVLRPVSLNDISLESNKMSVPERFIESKTEDINAIITSLSFRLSEETTNAGLILFL